jgi:hypothetical protein
MPTLDDEIIAAAIDGLEAKKQHIDIQIAELRAMLKGAPAITSAPAKGRKGGKRKLSAEAIQRMREGQKRRWAKVKGESAPAAKAAPKSKPKRRMSAAGRKAIAAAQKKRWAAKKAAAS